MGSVRIQEPDTRARYEDGEDERTPSSTRIFASRDEPSTGVPPDLRYLGTTENIHNDTPSAPTKSKKRRKIEDPERDDEDDGDNQDEKNSSASSTSKRRLACPFFKRKPTNTRPSCVYPGFSSIARLKEHLYRQHMLPAHKCPRCSKYFLTDSELYEHSRTTVPCQVNDNVTLEGITLDQEKALKSKKRTSKSGAINNDEEKWRDIYTILFPKENIPSPYCDTISAPPQYEDFMRREFPSLVRQRLHSTLNPRLQVLDEETKIRIVDLVRDCQEDLFSRLNPSPKEMANDDIPSVVGNPKWAPDEQREDSYGKTVDPIEESDRTTAKAEENDAKPEPPSSPPVQDVLVCPADTPMSGMSTTTQVEPEDMKSSKDSDLERNMKRNQ